jgi:diguanylate cyclase (GGDEF)-like protein
MARGLSMFDANQRLIVCNRFYRDMYGLPDWIARKGTALSEIIRYHAIREGGTDGPHDRERQEIWIADHLARLKQGHTITHASELKDGRTVLVTSQPLSDGGWVDLDEDITERRQAEEKIHRLAMYDTLTDLPNRFHFHQQLREALALLPSGHGVALHWVDLDRFKEINDTFGHMAGDDLLKIVGDRLRKAIRLPDFAGRLGGDEFAVVQSGVTSQKQAQSFAERLLRILSEPYQINGELLELGASIGIAVAPSDGTASEELIKKADIALYQAKSSGRGRITIFQSAFGDMVTARHQLEADLKVAIELEQFELHYQPIIDAKTREVRAFEALMRWRHPLRGLTPPAEFIPLAEETGLIVQMGTWAIRKACADAVGWPEAISVAVNLSSLQIDQCDLRAVVVEALAASGLAARRLELEITETTLLRDDEKTLEVLRELCDLGVRISLDDFGTGFASLSYLRSFPFHKIKIDRMFVKELPESEDCTAIVSAITAMAKLMNMSVVAEGVERVEQLNAVISAGCSFVQGYYFSPPVPGADVDDVLVRCRRNMPEAA